MAQINKPSDYFNTVLYTGNGSTNAITGVGHQPDLVWIKDRTVGFDHVLQDSVRGTTKIVSSNHLNAEFTNANSITSFDSDGWTTGSYVATNQNTTPFVAWNWLAGGSASSNTDGSITSSVSANTTSGFSIVSYTGTGANATVGHGLGVAPKMIIMKNRDDGTANWVVGHGDIGWGNILFLNATDASSSSSTTFQSTAPTSSVFSIGTSGRINDSGEDVIAYCFAEKKGFSKFGSYTGNGNADGPFIYTGFKPAFVMVKRTDSANSWMILDNKRNTFNVMSNSLVADTSAAEVTSTDRWDQLSNGFKLRNSGNVVNASGGSYIYMAFAETGLVGTNNIPATAR